MKDVCLVLEGTYPRTVGGVSTWVQELAAGLPEVSFEIVRLAHGEEPSGEARHAPPANASVAELALDPERPERLDGELPPARVYHALSTGFAGAVAARAARATGTPLVVTEHGLAWREAALPFVAGSHHYRPHAPVRDERRARIALHETLARDAYAAASAVTTVCAANARAQRALGAHARVLENAAAVCRLERTDATPRVGLIGRVTPVKDVLTFVRACALVARELPAAEFVVAGPLDHDEPYAERCLELAARLGLGERLAFTGETDVAALLPRLDAVALTSLSEAQPLALLEAMGAGIPVVATDVGGCRELVGAAGRAVPPASPHATASALLELLLDPALRARLGANGRRRVAARHSHARLLDAYRSLYAEVAAA